MGLEELDLPPPKDDGDKNTIKRSATLSQSMRQSYRDTSQRLEYRREYGCNSLACFFGCYACSYVLIVMFSIYLIVAGGITSSLDDLNVNRVTQVT